MRVRVLTMREISQHPRGSLSPHDWIFQTGETVFVDERDEAVVVRQSVDNVVFVSTLECVPGTTAAVACAMPEPVHLFRLARQAKRRASCR